MAKQKDLMNTFFSVFLQLVEKEFIKIYQFICSTI